MMTADQKAIAIHLCEQRRAERKRQKQIKKAFYRLVFQSIIGALGLYAILCLIIGVFG